MLELEVHSADSQEGKMEVDMKYGKEQKQTGPHKHELAFPRMNWNLCQFLFPLTLMECVSCRGQDTVTKLNSHTWPRTQKSERRIEGKVGQFQTQLLSCTTEVSQQKETMCSSYKMATDSLQSSKSPTIISPVSHPSWEHKGEGILGNVAEPEWINSLPIYYEVFYNLSYFSEWRIFSISSYPHLFLIQRKFNF